MPPYHVFLQREGAAITVDIDGDGSVTLAELLDRAAGCGCDVEEDDALRDNPALYAIRFKTNEDETVLAGLAAPFVLTDDVNQIVYWERIDKMEMVAMGAILLTQGQEYDPDEFENYPKFAGVEVPARATGSEVIAAVAAHLQVPVGDVTNLYREDCDLIPTFANEAERSRRRYINEWSDEGFDIGFIELSAVALAQLTAAAAKQALRTKAIRAMIKFYGEPAARAALHEAVDAATNQ